MNTGRAGRRIAAAALVASALAASDATAICARPQERLALESRVLQSELMVAALSCGYASDYNAFVRKFQPELMLRGQALRDYFARAHGRSGEHQMNRFVTVMANEASSRNIADQSQFCAKAGTLFDQLRSLDLRGYDQFLGKLPLADAHGIAACAGTQAADSGAPETPRHGTAPIKPASANTARK
jgi:hypothetical protein